MVTDSFEAIRPKLVLLKNIEDAATAVDEIFASTVQESGRAYSRIPISNLPIYLRDSDSFPVGGEGSGDDSGDEGERPTNDDDDEEDDDEDDNGTVNSLVGPSRSTETSFSFLHSSTSVGRLQNQRLSSRHPKKFSAPTRKKMRSLRKSSLNS